MAASVPDGTNRGRSGGIFATVARDLCFVGPVVVAILVAMLRISGRLRGVRSDVEV